MHMVIRAVVLADSEEEALTEAAEIFDKLVEDHTIDYYTLFNDHSSMVSGPSRWGDYPVAAKLDTYLGMSMVREGLAYTKDAIRESMDAVRKAFAKYTNDEIIEERWAKDEDTLVRLCTHYCYRIGQYTGSSRWLYAGGQAIASNREWSDFIRYTKEDDRKRLWVVPADIHH